MTTSGRLEQVARNLRSLEAAAMGGIGFAVLYIAALTLLGLQPDLSASSSEIADWYSDGGNRRTVILALNLAVLSVIAFLWFIAVIRRRLGDREDRFFATVFLGSGILFAALMSTGVAALSSTALALEIGGTHLPDSASFSFATGLGEGLLFVAVPRMQAVFLITTSTLVLRAGVLSRWLAILGYVVALVMLLLPLVVEPLGFGFPVWVAILSGAFLVRRDQFASAVDGQRGGP